MRAVIIVAAVLTVLFLLVWLRVIVELEVRTRNFKAEGSVKIRFLGGLVPWRVKAGKPPKKEEKPAETSAALPPDKKMELDDVLRLKDMLLSVIQHVFAVLKKSVKIHRLETRALVALEDPMANGIAYGVVSGVLNMSYAALLRNFSMKGYTLDIANDFESGEGLIFENRSKLSVRPVVFVTRFLAALMKDKKFMEALKGLRKIFSKEEKK